MKTVKWLLENDIFNEELDPLIEEIKKQGMEMKIHNHVPFEGDESWLKLYNEDDCVIFWGRVVIYITDAVTKYLHLRN